LPYKKIYGESTKKESAEYKAFLETITTDYTHQFKRLLNSEKLSEETRKILLDNYQLEFATFLLGYDRNYGYNNKEKNLPSEFYTFLQEIPMNDKELLSTPQFGAFINRFEYSNLFQAANKVYQQSTPQKTFFEYLFEELGIQKTPDDERFILQEDSLTSKLNQQDITDEGRRKIIDNYQLVWTEFLSKHGEDKLEAYKKKYIDVLFKQSNREIITEQWRIKDSVYREELKLTPGIVYDITKVRSLDFIFGERLENQKEECAIFLTHIESGIKETFLKEEAQRLYLKNYPLEKQAAYKLPDTPEAKIFKALIAPHKGKILLVDFWATTCGPCIASIKTHKELRERYKDSKDADFVFITAEDESPESAYNKFVEEQNLVNTYRLSADNYRYLRQLFRFNGIPKYIIVDREGNILNDDARSRTFENDLKEILELEK
jgi:thiol-disulfide isomerase/thioredoxin